MSAADAVLAAATAELRAGRLDAARTVFEQILRQTPGLAAALHGLGVTRARQGARAEAIGLLQAATAAAPDFAPGWGNLGRVLLEDGQTAAAVASYRTAVALVPQAARAHSDLGVALRTAGQEAAADSFAAALALDPSDVVAITGRARLLTEQNHHTEALAGFLKAAALDPGQPRHRWNAALSRLAMGDFAAGWRDFEARWYLGVEFPPAQRTMPHPRWTGAEPVAGRTVLLWAEQGFGDSFQFVRYAPLLAARGARVVVEAQPATLPLLARIPGVAAAVAPGAPLPPHDLHCPLMSLPLAFGTRLDSVPAPPRYLAADPAAAAAWQTRLTHLSGLKVGLVWAGSGAPGSIAARRSVAPNRLAALATVPGVAWISLQKDRDGPPPPLALHDWTADLPDFGATAALIEGLDLVISVDTSVAHLAAALGRPVWLLHRFAGCWRWLLGRTDSPWYPTLRIFRQPAPDAWEPVADAVAAALRERADA